MHESVSQDTKTTAEPQRVAEPARVDTQAEQTAPFMAAVSFIYLGLLALVLPHQNLDLYADEFAANRTTFAIIFAVLAVLTFVTAVETVVRLWKAERGTRSAAYVALSLGAVLLPPLRLSVRIPRAPRRLWLPVLGWHPIDNDLRLHLDRVFSVPMMVMALLIIPILGLEQYRAAWVAEHPTVQDLMGVTLQMIWLGFALEFTVMVAASEKRLKYCIKHWLDIAIIMLPVIAFMRMLRLAQLGRVGRLTQMSRTYRLKGLAMKGYHAILLLVISTRFGRGIARRRIVSLRRTIVEREEEIAMIRTEIAALEASLPEGSSV
jgi:hypothetical protein